MNHITASVIGLVTAFALPLSSLAEGLQAPAVLTTCVSCHGMHGEGASGGVPRLAGQNQEYLSHALSMFKAGSRASAIMQPIARTVSDADIGALAQYFSNQSAPSVDGHATVSPQLLGAGKQLAEAGASACFSCHGAGGTGNGARYPGISGQPERFIVNRLHEFQERARGKAPQPGTMTAVAATMTEEQIEASAAYLSQLQR